MVLTVGHVPFAVAERQKGNRDTSRIERTQSVTAPAPHSMAAMAAVSWDLSATVGSTMTDFAEAWKKGRFQAAGAVLQDLLIEGLQEFTRGQGGGVSATGGERGSGAEDERAAMVGRTGMATATATVARGETRPLPPPCIFLPWSPMPPLLLRIQCRGQSPSPCPRTTRGSRRW